MLTPLQSQLLAPVLLEEFCAEYTRHMSQLRGEECCARLGSARSEHSKLARQRENIIQAIKDGVPASEVRDDLAQLTARCEELEALLTGTKKDPVLLHPVMATRYRTQVANLVHILNREDNRAEPQPPNAAQHLPN